MTFLKNKRILSLLLALVLVVSAFPLSALAAETCDDYECSCADCAQEHCEDECECEQCLEECEHEHCEDEGCQCAECEEITEPVEPVEESGLIWEMDESNSLHITIVSKVPTFISPEDQPWKAFRDEIQYAYIADESGLTVDSMAYWFSGCVELSYAEVASNIAEIGYHAFYNCPKLMNIVLLHEKVPSLVQGAFETLNPLEWKTDVDPRPHIKVYSDDTLAAVCAYDWGKDNCPITVTKASRPTPGLLKAAPLLGASASGTCSSCKTTCSYTVDYEQWTDSVHCVRHWCSNCGLDQCGGVNAESHTYNNSGSCTKCGYYNSAYDYSVCYHTSTRISWSGCDWYEYCRSCGELVDWGTSHGSTYTTWNGCKWYDYCSDCGQLMDYGTSHSYSYGSWEYYSSSQHRRLGTCTRCGATTYSYGSHSTTKKYTSYSATQHQYGSYCSTCGSYTGSTTKSNHSFTYGSWTNYNGTQHRRTKSCSTCGYSEYEYASHSLSYGSWTNYSSTQHRRSVTCSCGYSTYEYEKHSTTPGAWASISDTQHRRTLTCSCGYSTTETASHSLSYTAWTSISDTQHERTGSCTCGYSKTTKANHADKNGDGCCDDCGYLLTRFSVTIPASLSIAMAENGAITTATNASIVNNSTAAVKVSGVTVTAENGWTLVPFNYNMAAAKVDSKLIGFSINNAKTVKNGKTDALSIGNGWSIAKGASLPLSYDAVISATSTAITKQNVLTLVFVVNWA